MNEIFHTDLSLLGLPWLLKPLILITSNIKRFYVLMFVLHDILWPPIQSLSSTFIALYPICWWKFGQPKRREHSKHFSNTKCHFRMCSQPACNPTPFTIKVRTQPNLISISEKILKGPTLSKLHTFSQWIMKPLDILAEEFGPLTA